MGLYKHKITALAGIVNFLEKHYPESPAVKGIKTEKICKSYVTVNYKSINDLMKEFRKEHNPKFEPSKNLDRNAEYVQKHWKDFVFYLRNNLLKF